MVACHCEETSKLCIAAGDVTVMMSTDVDVAEPDEKSLITYVSSLYDVFPDVPSMEQSLRDSVCTSVLYIGIK